MKITEIREMTREELAAQSRELKLEMVNLRVQQASGQLENPSRIRIVRRDIAQDRNCSLRANQSRSAAAAAAAATTA